MNFINSQKEEIEEFVKKHPPPQQDKWNIKNEWMQADQYSTWQSERHWYIGKAWTKMSPLGLLPHRPFYFPNWQYQCHILCHVIHLFIYCCDEVT